MIVVDVYDFLFERQGITDRKELLSSDLKSAKYVIENSHCR